MVQGIFPQAVISFAFNCRCSLLGIPTGGLSMLRLIACIVLFPGSLLAATADQLDRLHSVLQTDVLMEILSEEGHQQSEDLREEMFPGRGGVGWTTTIGQIYKPERLATLFRDAFNAELRNANVEPLLDFYEGDTGVLVAALEVEARRAIMSEEVEAAARAAYEDVRGTGSQREALLEEFADLNGLVDRNVAGALNANLAFYRGLATGDAFEMTEEQMLSDVWEQEAGIREDTIGWVFGYMTFAYETLDDEQLRTYVDLTATEAGRELNRALFAGFDAVFLDVSFALGAATARFSLGDEL
jgi:hypothetical protein